MAKATNKWKGITLYDRSFLLRCWQEPVSTVTGSLDRASHWRFSLTGMGEQPFNKGFASLDELVTFLREELAGQVASNKLTR